MKALTEQRPETHSTMKLQKELLLLLITIMHISLMTCSPMKSKSCEEELTKLKRKLGFFLLDLKNAESAFVKYFYANGSIPYRNLKPLNGITFPVGSTTDPSTLNSTCAINDYLKNHLPPIVNNLTLDIAVKEKILNKTRMFQDFVNNLVELIKSCPNENKLRECPRELPTLRGYGKIKYAFQILHSAVNWTESYTNNMLP